MRRLLPALIVILGIGSPEFADTTAGIAILKEISLFYAMARISHPRTPLTSISNLRRSSNNIRLNCWIFDSIDQSFSDFFIK